MQVLKPAFVGVNQPFALTVGSHWFNANEVVWQIPSGDNLLTWSVQPTTPHRLSATAGSAPGTVQVRVRIKRWGKVCESTHTVHIVQYEPVTIRYATFIPCEIVPTPLSWLPDFGLVPDYFWGDERIDAASNTSLFSATHLRYRACCQVTIRVSDHWINPPQHLHSQVPPFGVTAAFNSQNVAADATQCGWQRTGNPYTTTTHPATPETHEILFGQVSHRVVRVRFRVNARDPLVPFEQACALNASLQFFITQEIDPLTGRQESQVIYEGAFDQYPSHELYIAPVGMYPQLPSEYTFDSYTPEFRGPLDLCNSSHDPHAPEHLEQIRFGPIIRPLVH